MLNSILGKFLRWYRANRIKFLTYVGGAVLAYALIMTFNNNVKENNAHKVLNNTSVSEQVSSNIEEANKSTIESSMAIVGGNTKSETEIDEANNLVNTFVNFCNQEKFENAYNLISDDCKNALYPTVDVFITEYCNKIFNCVKTYSIQNYSGDTYRVIYKDSLLETGGKATSAEIVDYITVIDENKKISINGFIKKKEINKEYKVENLEIKVVAQLVFIDYEKFDIQLSNKGIYDVKISDLQSHKDIYAKDEKDEFSYVALNELSTAMVNIQAGTTKNVVLKFNKTYSNRTIDTLCLNNINFNKENSAEVKELVIEI